MIINIIFQVFPMLSGSPTRHNLFRFCKRYGFTDSLKRYKEERIQTGKTTLWVTGSNERKQLCIPATQASVPFPMTLDVGNDTITKLSTCISHCLAVSSQFHLVVKHF